MNNPEGYREAVEPLEVQRVATVCVRTFNVLNATSQAAPFVCRGQLRWQGGQRVSYCGI